MQDKIKEIRENYEFLDLQLVDFFGKLKTISLPVGFVSEENLSQGIGFDASNLHYADVTKSDLVIIPDLSTAHSDPFKEIPTCSVMGNIGFFPDHSQEPKIFPYDPRDILSNALKTLRNKGIAHQLMVLPELEFYLFDALDCSTESLNNYVEIDCEEPMVNRSKGYHSPIPFDAFAEVRMEIVKELQNIGIPVKYHHHEVGLPGQCEIELDFLPLEIAGDAIIQSKYIVRNVAHQWNLHANFMPKPIFGLPGSGMHLHMYLANEKGDSIFYDQSTTYKLSNKAMSFMGGILLHLGSLMAFSNPSTNSYKRLVSGYEAPQDKSFAKSNRNAAIRIPAYTRLEETRFEYRTGDAICNPYYTLAALLMAGIDGIEKNIDPEDASQVKREEAIPRNLYEAMDALKKDHAFLDPVIKKDMIDEWIHQKVKEADFPNNYPNPAEFDTYINY